MPPKNTSIFDDFKKLRVGSRYSYEIWLLKFNNQAGAIFLGEDIISKTVDNIDWANKVRNLAVNLNNTSDKCYFKFLSKHCTLFGNRFETYEKNLNQFLNETK